MVTVGLTGYVWSSGLHINDDVKFANLLNHIFLVMNRFSCEYFARREGFISFHKWFLTGYKYVKVFITDTRRLSQKVPKKWFVQKAAPIWSSCNQFPVCNVIRKDWKSRMKCQRSHVTRHGESDRETRGLRRFQWISAQLQYTSRTVDLGRLHF